MPLPPLLALSAGTSKPRATTPRASSGASRTAASPTATSRPKAQPRMRSTTCPPTSRPTAALTVTVPASTNRIIDAERIQRRSKKRSPRRKRSCRRQTDRQIGQSTELEAYSRRRRSRSKEISQNICPSRDEFIFNFFPYESKVRSAVSSRSSSRSSSSSSSQQQQQQQRTQVCKPKKQAKANAPNIKRNKKKKQ